MAHNRLHDERLPRGVSKVRRNSGVAYEARYTDPNGRQKQRTFRTKTEARQFIEGTRTKVREGTYVDPKPARTLLGDVAASYFAARQTALRPTTMAMNRSLYSTHVAPAFANRHLSTIHLDDVQRFANELAATHAPGTVHACVNLLKRILGHAVDRGLLLANPADRAVLPSRDSAERRYLTPQQVSALCDAVPGRYRALVLMAAYTGMRWGELAGLKTTRLNLLRRQVQVSEILVEVNGHFSFGPPKTKESRRTITLPSFLVDELAEHLASFPPNVHVEGETLVFTGPNGAPLRRSNFARRVWRPALRKAGLEHVSFHALRHSAAAFMIGSGADAKKIQRRLGHATIRMTYDLYGHLLPEADEEVAAGLEDLWRAAVPAPAATVVELR